MKFSRSEPTNTGDWRIEEDVRLESRDFFEIKAMSKSAGTNKWKGGISHHRSSSITMGNGGNTMGKPSLTHAYYAVYPMDPSTFCGSIWGLIQHLEL